MKLSELRQCFAGNEARYREYAVLLVDLDTVPSDGVDVVISPLRAVQVDPDAGEVRLISAAVSAESDGVPLALFEFFAQALPMAGVHDVDFVVKAQLPIAPEGLAIQDSTLALGGVWIGLAEEEIWLLVRPQSEYPQDLLPS